MNVEELSRILLAGAASLGGMAGATAVRFLLDRLSTRGRTKSAQSYSERLTGLMASLTKATIEVDAVLRELAGVASEREAAVAALQADLGRLQAQEQELRQKVELLRNTPVPVAEHFAKLVASGERRSARRDYVLFGAGVVVTTVIAILIQSLGR